MVVVVVVPAVMLVAEHALLVGVARYDARGGRGRELGVGGHVIGAAVQGQRRLREGVQALPGGMVRAAQAAEERRVIHGRPGGGGGGGSERHEPAGERRPQPAPRPLPGAPQPQASSSRSSKWRGEASAPLPAPLPAASLRRPQRAARRKEGGPAQALRGGSGSPRL